MKNNNHHSNKRSSKRAYIKPLIRKIGVDTKISLLMMSEPPDDPWIKILRPVMR